MCQALLCNFWLGVLEHTECAPERTGGLLLGAMHSSGTEPRSSTNCPESGFLVRPSALVGARAHWRVLERTVKFCEGVAVIGCAPKHIICVPEHIGQGALSGCVVRSSTQCMRSSAMSFLGAELVFHVGFVVGGLKADP